MPRLTPLRVFKILTLPWLMLTGLWLFLPSTPRPTGSRDTHIQSTLVSGHTLTTIHRWNEWRDGDDDATHPHRLPDGCQGLILDWQLLSQPAHDSTSLLIGDTRVNLTDALIRAGPYGSFAPYLSDPLAVRAGAGDTDNIVNMPWFHWADQVVFHHYMHGFDETVTLRVYVPAPGVVEVWKDSALWRRWPRVEVRESDRHFSRLLTVSNLLTVKEAGWGLGHLKVDNVKGELVSLTFPVRWALLGPLAPVASIGFGLARDAVDVVVEEVPSFVSVGVAAVLLCWWIVARRRRQSRRRQQKAQIWGPAGPVYDDDDDSMSYGWKQKNTSTGQRFRISIFDGVGDKPRSKGSGLGGDRFSV